MSLLNIWLLSSPGCVAETDLYVGVVLVFRVRYHAARGLIYLGCMDVGGVYLFKRVPGKVAEFAFYFLV